MIKEEKFLEIYEHYGSKTIQKLEYTAHLTNAEINTQSRFKLLFIKIIL